jgi:two-component system, chemotaxis family, chemotaxis protein CheY
MPKTILIVDDSRTWRLASKLALTNAGYDVVEACDGLQALGEVKKTKFSLIVCDVNMPNMDGITFVRELKQLPEHKFTPVIMLTTKGEEELKQQGQAAGAKAWMLKPFKADKLVAAVSKFIMP